MKLKYKTIKKIPLIASLAFLVGCSTTPVHYAGLRFKKIKGKK